MAQYGTAGSQGYFGPKFTGWSGVLGTAVLGNVRDPVAPSTSGAVQFNGLTQDDNRIANLFQGKSNQAIRMLLISMIGAAPGGLATKSFKRITAQTGLDTITGPGAVPGANLGGLVPIETVSYINRTNTVTDDNNLTAMLNRTHGPASYPADVSGVGGGSKAQINGTQYY